MQWGPNAEAGRDGEVLEIEVLAENLTQVEVYLRCKATVSIGMAVHYQGISAQEVMAACRLMRIRPTEWPDVLEGVQHMGDVVAEIWNKRASQS